MANGESPYDYLSPEFRPVLDEALDKVPGARPLFDQGKVGNVVAELRRAGFAREACQLDLSMPYMFSV